MGLGNGINDYGPSHDTIALRSEQQFDNDNYYGTDHPSLEGCVSGAYYIDGKDFSNALSKAPSHVWMRLPKHIGERLDISLGRNIAKKKSTIKKAVRDLPADPAADVIMEQVSPVEKEEKHISIVVDDTVEKHEVYTVM
uniref:Uncharacterized protein n=1 Tax=Ditylum brightwellii TaxID=49249 RepID=A0A6U3T7X5_9STRA|mmetsp:Transcript_36881/g.55150  ORF Transcript_36881/g.55150 Transcript_36881/m.55150 type:complete len:139 (+) Transcript_36881:379-795(+)